MFYKPSEYPLTVPGAEDAEVSKTWPCTPVGGDTPGSRHNIPEEGERCASLAGSPVLVSWGHRPSGPSALRSLKERGPSLLQPPVKSSEQGCSHSLVPAANLWSLESQTKRTEPRGVPGGNHLGFSSPRLPEPTENLLGQHYVRCS